MPTYTNYYKNTAVPVNTTSNGKPSIDEKRQRYFDNYYTKVQSVDPAQFDIVNGFLEGRNYSESVKRNLSISLLEIAKEQGLSVTDLINQLSTIEDTLKLNTLLCILFNTTRNRTSVIGFSQSNKVISTVQRTILA
jgi:hypothetical protein